MWEKANEQRFERKHPVQQSLKDTFRAQNGEDRWLDNFFEHKRNGFFVEVGAFDGINLSNSYHFEQIGWTGVLIEPDPDKAALCRSNRPGSRTYQCAAAGSPEISEVTFFRVESGEVYSTTKLTGDHARRIDQMALASMPISVPARTLDAILQEVGAPVVDFVSIDVEGAEMEVLRGFDIRRWRPAIVVIESNSKLRLREVRDYFTSNGYAFRCSIDVNDFYLCVDPGPVPAWTIDAAYYAWRRVNRRICRLAHNIRRSWSKRRGRKI